MHRTRTAAMILVGVAVSAVSGCVAVPPQPTTAPPADPPRLSQDVQPQIVQAPALEALEAALPPSPAPSAPAPQSPAAAAQGETPQRAATARPAPAHPRQEPGSRSATPPKGADPLPRALPSLPLPIPPGAAAGAKADVCALGEGYGGWRPDSPESRICRETYGH
ncbi:MAG TPA: hypothetical protein VFH94_18780 [Streptomyces sp.]|nr:hypothetical protein [Streptomyces sp.]